MLAGRKSPKRRATGLRDSERTRERLLKAGYREVYRSGFQSASIDTILAATNVTKGALYYHFESKEALGYAIIDEVVATFPRNRWLLPLRRSEDKDPIDALIGIVQAIPARPRDLKGGCPLVNLAQEMSQLDEQFRKRLETIFRAWQEGVAMALRRGQSQGTVRRDFPADETASFLIAMVEGYEVLAKNAQDPVKVWNVGIRNIVGWLQSLRTPGNRNRAKRFKYIMKRRTNNDKDRSVAQESARNGSLRAGGCREPAGTGKCQRIGRAELNERGASPEVVRSLGEERLGPSG
jgi:TetR/AcrR family transcriptional regulator, transcriptional repressor for nem operon